MPFLDRDGASIHYEATGAGPLVLLTHGFSSSGDAFTGNLPAIVAAGFRVVTWDLRGHGATDAGDDPSAYTVPLALADMAALLDVEGADWRDPRRTLARRLPLPLVSHRASRASARARPHRHGSRLSRRQGACRLEPFRRSRRRRARGCARRSRRCSDDAHRGRHPQAARRERDRVAAVHRRPHDRDRR